ncbi:MAG: regulatory protein RecX [Nitrospirota bacterium]
MDRELKRARELAYRYLALRDRSVSELRDYFRRKEVPADVVETVLGEFIRYGYLDDRRFAASFAKSLIERKGLSRYALKMELKRKGVPEGDIEQALEGLFGENGYDEDEVARSLARKKAKSLGNLPQDKARRRLADYLRRRGFSFEAVRKAMTGII